MKINGTTFELTSANPARICLPCQITDDLSLEAAKALWESGKDIQDTASITAYLVLHVSPVKPFCGYRLEVTTTDGQTIVKHLKADFTPEQTADTLSRFFAAGAPGLGLDMRKLYERRHRQYKSHNHKQAA